MNVDITKKPSELTHISLCSGYGGIDLGFKRAGLPIRTVTYVEIETFVCQNLVAKMEKGWIDVAPIWTNLKTFNWGLFNGKVDILSGGFPCQPFSQAGRRDGSEDPRHLWPYIVEGIKQLGRPPIVFFENVEGIISSKLKGNTWADPEGTSVLHHVLKELERLGYEATAGVFSASEVGAPHQRKRVFILGVNSRLNKQGRDFITSKLSRGFRPILGDSEINDEQLWRAERVDKRGEVQEGVAVQTRQPGLPNERWVAYPAARGVGQYSWEPPRTVMGHTGKSGLEGEVPQTQSRKEPTKPTAGSSSHGVVCGEIESSLGGDLDGCTCGVDISELYTRTDNRTDELRMLGNGVVPGTATKAIRIMWKQLVNSDNNDNNRKQIC